MKKTGLTLLEILVASMIMTLVMVSLANIFLMSKRHLQYSRSKIQTAELGKLVLEPLQMEVTLTETSPGAQDGWNQANNCFTNPATGCDTSNRTLNNIIYSPAYNITPITNTTLNKVRVTIAWNETAP